MIGLALRHPHDCPSPTALVGSDGNCVATYGIVNQGMPNPPDRAGPTTSIDYESVTSTSQLTPIPCVSRTATVM
jgi:hypothetical protein